MTAPRFALGYGTNGFADHPLGVAVDLLEQEGYEAVALTVGFPHLDPFAVGCDTEVQAFAARLARAHDGAGMRVVVETGTRYLLDVRHKHRPVLVDGEAADRLRYLRRAVEIAGALRAECVSFFSGVLPEDASPAEGRERLLDRLPGLVEHADAHGVRLALEPEPGMLIETVEDALRLHDDLGAPDGLGLTVDVGHCLVVEPQGVEGALRAAAPRLLNVQLDDMPRSHHEHRPFGEGDLDLPRALGVLDEIGYRGVAAVELPRHSFDAPGLARRSATALRDAWAVHQTRDREVAR